MQKLLHDTLPGLIDSIPVQATAARLSGGKPLASLEMLRLVMALLRQVEVDDNYNLIEQKCLRKARMLDKIYKPAVPTERARWFRVGIAGLRRNKRRASKKQVGEMVVATRGLRSKLEAAGPTMFASETSTRERLGFLKRFATGSDGGAT